MLENFLLFWAQLLTVSKKKRGDTVICKLSRLNTNTGLPLAAVCGKEGGGSGGGGGGGKHSPSSPVHSHLYIKQDKQVWLLAGGICVS